MSWLEALFCVFMGISTALVVILVACYLTENSCND